MKLTSPLIVNFDAKQENDRCEKSQDFRLENIQHVQTQTDQDVPVVPASLVMFIPNASAPTLPVAQVISDSGSDKFT